MRQCFAPYQTPSRTELCILGNVAFSQSIHPFTITASGRSAVKLASTTATYQVIALNVALLHLNLVLLQDSNGKTNK